jgi:hypothetical protein
MVKSTSVGESLRACLPVGRDSQIGRPRGAALTDFLEECFKELEDRMLWKKKNCLGLLRRRIV